MEDRFMLIDTANHMLCEGQVKEFWRTEGTFQIESGIKELKKIEEGQSVRFMFMEGHKGIFVGQVVNKQGTTLLVENIKNMGADMKEDVRIKTDIDTKLFATNGEDDITAWSVVVDDISAGGAAIKIKTKIPLEQKLELAVPYGSTYMMINLIPLREQIEEEGFKYGCKFYDLTRTEEKMVRSMVFKIAARLAKKG